MYNHSKGRNVPSFLLHIPSFLLPEPFVFPPTFCKTKKARVREPREKNVLQTKPTERETQYETEFTEKEIKITSLRFAARSADENEGATGTVTDLTVRTEAAALCFAKDIFTFKSRI